MERRLNFANFIDRNGLFYNCCLFIYKNAI